jgi:hypothetical protein
MTTSTLLQQAERGGEAAARSVLLLLLPQDLIDFQAFDADLASAAGLVSNPHHPCMDPIDATLQQDDIACPEVMPGRMESRAGGGHVEGADVSDPAGGKKIDFKWDCCGATFFA